MYEAHRQNSRPPLKLVKAYAFVSYAETQMLEEKPAPDTICGAAKRSGQFEETVCAKTLYNYIDQCLLKVRGIDLLLKVKRKQHTKARPANRRLYGMSIEDRPGSVNRREEFGHWEIDTVVGTRESSAVLLTLDERTTRFRHIIKIPSRSAQAVEQGFQQLRAALLPATTAASSLASRSCVPMSPFTMRTLSRPMSAASMRSRIRSSAASSQKAALWTTSPLMPFSEYRIGSLVSRVNHSFMPPPLTASALSYLILQFRAFFQSSKNHSFFNFELDFY